MTDSFARLKDFPLPVGFQVDGDVGMGMEAKRNRRRMGDLSSLRHMLDKNRANKRGKEELVNGGGELRSINRWCRGRE